MSTDAQFLVRRELDKRSHRIPDSSSVRLDVLINAIFEVCLQSRS